MKIKNNKESGVSGVNLVERIWERSWTYIKTVVDVVRQPILVLDKDLRVMAANESFYHTFQVDQKSTENKVIYELGNGQWDILALRKLLEDILPKNTFFKGFEVAHKFPLIGYKVMILNARQIHVEDDTDKMFPPIILLAMEDITEMMAVAEKLAEHANHFEMKMAERSKKMEVKILELGVELKNLKNKVLKTK